MVGRLPRGTALEIRGTDEDEEIAPRHRTCSVLVWPGVEPGAGGRGSLRSFLVMAPSLGCPDQGNSIFHQEHAGTGNDQTARGNSEA